MVGGQRICLGCLGGKRKRKDDTNSKERAIMKMRMKLTCLMLAFVMVLNGCGYFTALPYPAIGVHWVKKGLDDEEVRRFHRQCYPRWSEMYRSISRDLVVDLEIEGQKCMLANGFTFKDASRPHGKLCSRDGGRRLGIENHMIFPACQSKYGKYRK